MPDITDHLLVTLPFADGNHPFRLTWPLAVEWEKTLGQSLNGTFVRIIRERAVTVTEVRELIRLALIGGGMKPGKALKLVRIGVEQRPLEGSIEIALTILNAFLFGAASLDKAADTPGIEVDADGESV